MDIVAGVDQVTPTAEKMRRLMHYGQVLQSNALNFFHLASPDLLLGFRGAGRAAQHHRRDRSLSRGRQMGDLHPQIRPAGDRRDRRPAHPSAAVHPGRRQPEPVRRKSRRAAQDIDQIIQWCGEALELHKSFVRAHETLHETFASFPSSYMSLVGADGGMDLYDGTLRAIDADGEADLRGRRRRPTTATT
jgi:NAD-reducing hydrogenase large subunit